MLWWAKQPMRSAGCMLSIHLSLLYVCDKWVRESVGPLMKARTALHMLSDRYAAGTTRSEPYFSASDLHKWLYELYTGWAWHVWYGRLVFQCSWKKKHEVVLLFGLRLMFCCIIWLKRSHLSGKTQFQQNKIKGKIPGNDTVCLSCCLPLL